MGAASLRIYANIVTRPQADRACILVDPTLDRTPMGLPPEFILSNQPPSAAQWRRLSNQYQSLLYCPVGRFESPLAPNLSRADPIWRCRSPRTRVRTQPCNDLLHALAISQVVQSSPLPIDVVLPLCRPQHWQHIGWQPGFWRWQLSSSVTQRRLSWQQLWQQLNQLDGIAWVQLQSGDLGTLTDVLTLESPQAGRLIRLRRQQPEPNQAINPDHPWGAAPTLNKSRAIVARS